MSRTINSLIFAVLLVLTGCKSASPDPGQRVRTGEEIFEACLLCHSTKEMQRGPIIAGLPEWYVVLQLEKFHEGIRGTRPENRSEYLMATGMTNFRNTNEFQIVASHISKLPVPKHLKVIKGNPARGKDLYKRCVACHGANGEGNRELDSPPLDTIEDWYHLDQLIRYRAGLRGYHTNDIGGIAMRVAVINMSTRDFRDIVHYVTDLTTRD